MTYPYEQQPYSFLVDGVPYPTGGAAGHYPNYVVWGAAPTVYVLDTATGVTTTYATEILALHFCRDNGPATGTMVGLIPPFATTGTLVINRNEFSLITMAVRNEGSYNPTIQNIQIDASAAARRGILIYGIHSKQWHFDCTGGNEIERVRFVNCSILNWAASAGQHGIWFQGDGTAAGFINEVTFDNCEIYSAGAGTTTWGVVNYDNLHDSTEIRFNNCEFKTNADNNTFFCSDGDSEANPTVLLNPRFYMGTCTGIRIIYVASPNSHTKGFSMQWIGGRVESHATYTLLQNVNNATYTGVLNFIMVGASIGSWNAGAHTLFQIGVTNWANLNNSLQLGHNKFGGTGTWTFGVPTSDQYFSVNIDKNHGVNPINVVANPFDNTDNLIQYGGAAATPTASTTYTVDTTGIKLSSTDSGNTDCAIDIMDGAGTSVLQATLSSIDHIYIPHGFQITWGAFTGAAPTVTIAFE